MAQIETDQILLDPFCGSGTILSEALALGYTKIFGTDLSAKAVKDSRDNLNWLAKQLKLKDFTPHVNQIDAKELSQVVPAGVNAIITEPYLGKPMRGNESIDLVKKIIAEVEELYFTAFSEFKKILIAGGRIVIVIPEWHIGGKINIGDNIDNGTVKALGQLDETIKEVSMYPQMNGFIGTNALIYKEWTETTRPTRLAKIFKGKKKEFNRIF